MKKTESGRCSTIHAELTIAPVRTIQKSEEAKLIHEHYLVPARRMELNQYATCCITCGDCYCQICGKLARRMTSIKPKEFIHPWTLETYPKCD